MPDRIDIPVRRSVGAVLFAVYAALVAAISLILTASAASLALYDIIVLMWPGFFQDPSADTDSIYRIRQGLLREAITVLVSLPIFIIHFRLLWRLRKENNNAT